MWLTFHLLLGITFKLPISRMPLISSPKKPVSNDPSPAIQIVQAFQAPRSPVRLAYPDTFCPSMPCANPTPVFLNLFLIQLDNLSTQ